MEDQKKHIDDLFRQQLNDYQEAPRAGMWDRIEDGLDKIDTTKKPGNKNTGGSRGLLGYSIALLLIAGAAFFIFKQSHEQSFQSVAGNKTAVVNKVVTAKEGEANNISPNGLNEGKVTATTITTKSTTANNAISAGKPTSANTSGSAISENIKRANIKSHTANRVAGRKSHHTAHPNNLVNNSNTTTADKQYNKDKANTETNTKADDNVTALQPSAESHIAKAAKKKSKVLDEVAQARLQKDRDAAPEVSSKKIPENQASQLSNPTKVEADKTKKRAKLTKINKVDQSAVIPSASLPASKKIADKTGVDISKGKQAERQVKQEAALPDINAEKKSKTERNDKKVAAAEKKIQLPVNNSSAIMPESKPVAANKSEAKEMLKQQVAESKQQEPTKNTVDTSIAGNNNKDNAAASGGGSDDVAHQGPMAFNLQAGIKLGYEQGFGQYTTSKFLGAVYAQVGLSDKLAIMLQPAIKYTKLSNNINYSANSYYNNTGKVKDSTEIVTDSLASYRYFGTYDSLVVKRAINNTSYIGFEIPVLLKYNLSKSFAVLGGVNIDISNLFAVSDAISTIHLSTPIDSTGIVRVHQFNPFFDTLTYRHPGTPYSAYTPASSATQATVRLGYMLGVDYSLADKFTLEFLVTQSLSGYNNISDKNIKNIYSQPYFRLSVGYRFLNITRKKTPYNGGL